LLYASHAAVAASRQLQNEGVIRRIELSRVEVKNWGFADPAAVVSMVDGDICVLVE